MIVTYWKSNEGKYKTIIKVPKNPTDAFIQFVNKTCKQIDITNDDITLLDSQLDPYRMDYLSCVTFIAEQYNGYIDLYDTKKFPYSLCLAEKHTEKLTETYKDICISVAKKLETYKEVLKLSELLGEAVENSCNLIHEFSVVYIPFKSRFFIIPKEDISLMHDLDERINSDNVIFNGNKNEIITFLSDVLTQMK